MNIEERIEQLIKEKGYTKKAFSDKIGIQRQNFNAMIKSPSYPTLEKIAAGLEISIRELFPEEVQEPDDKNMIVCPKCHTRFKEID